MELMMPAAKPVLNGHQHLLSSQLIVEPVQHQFTLLLKASLHEQNPATSRYSGFVTEIGIRLNALLHAKPTNNAVALLSSASGDRPAFKRLPCFQQH